MSGIYIHIPFCKQACHYCDFHFSTSTKKKEDMVLALAKEIELRKSEFQDEPVETIYFGGGTPSILDISDLKLLIDAVYTNFNIVKKPEITVEANPDDLSKELIIELFNNKVNRLSIGIQSFFDDDLQLMNRAHNSAEAKECLEFATHYFDNISIDLIYGIPGLTYDRWKKNIETALSFGVNHISSYALTVEPKTALATFVEKGSIEKPDEDIAFEQFHTLVNMLTEKDFVHYELSNFGKENFFSKNNSAYWLGKKYIGIGPSAHSFDGKVRGWNVSNNSKYIVSIKNNIVPIEKEVLTKSDLYNEYIMTGLRTIWGVSLTKIEIEFGVDYLNYLVKNAEKFIQNGQLVLQDNLLLTTSKGKFLTDGISSSLFWIEN